MVPRALAVPMVPPLPRALAEPMLPQAVAIPMAPRPGTDCAEVRSAHERVAPARLMVCATQGYAGGGHLPRAPGPAGGSAALCGQAAGARRAQGGQLPESALRARGETRPIPAPASFRLLPPAGILADTAPPARRPASAAGPTCGSATPSRAAVARPLTAPPPPREVAAPPPPRAAAARRLLRVASRKPALRGTADALPDAASGASPVYGVGARWMLPSESSPAPAAGPPSARRPPAHSPGSAWGPPAPAPAPPSPDILFQVCPAQAAH